MKILFPFDGAKGSKNAVHYITELAKRFEKTELMVLYVINTRAIEEGSIGSEYFDTRTLRNLLYEEANSKAQKAFQKARELFEKEGLDITLKVVEGGNVAEEIVEEAWAYHANLIVMPTSKISKRVALGSVTDSVLRLTQCPILVVTPDSVSEPRFERILVTLDGSRHSKKAFEYALKMAETLGASLEIVYVVNEYVINYTSAVAGVRDDNWQKVVQSFEEEGRTMLDATAKRAVGSGVEVTPKVLIGDPAEKILQEAQDNDIDLIVMGSRGLGGVSRFFLGSVTGAVISHSDRPTLVVR